MRECQQFVVFHATSCCSIKCVAFIKFHQKYPGITRYNAIHFNEFQFANSLKSTIAQTHSHSCTKSWTGKNYGISKSKSNCMEFHLTVSRKTRRWIFISFYFIFKAKATAHDSFWQFVKFNWNWHVWWLLLGTSVRVLCLHEIVKPIGTPIRTPAHTYWAREVRIHMQSHWNMNSRFVRCDIQFKI